VGNIVAEEHGKIVGFFLPREFVCRTPDGAALHELLELAYGVQTRGGCPHIRLTTWPRASVVTGIKRWGLLFEK
jgi:hypothetical protein